MACYSHSRISTFEQCKYKYRLQKRSEVFLFLGTTFKEGAVFVVCRVAVEGLLNCWKGECNAC